MPSYAQFRQTRYFPELDGLRALSVLLVVAFHSTDPVWHRLNGYLGVPIFFVISGFLITTLLIREEGRNGWVDLSAFYLRRVFRIFPLYYLALIGYTVLVFTSDANPAHFLERIPLFITFNGEFAGSGTFIHSWSLGIEEKFYLIWPALAFVTAYAARRRGTLACTLLLITIAALFVPHINYFATYMPIIAGCILAISMHRERGFQAISHLTKSPVALALSAGTIFIMANNETFGWQNVPWRNVPFSIAVAALFPSFLIGAPKLRAILSIRAIRYVGSLAYGIYLFHPIALLITGKVIPPNGSLICQLIRMVLIFGGSVAVAAVLKVLIEQPMIKLGQCVIQRRHAGYRVSSRKSCG